MDVKESRAGSVISNDYFYDYMGLNKGKEFYVYLKDTAAEYSFDEYFTDTVEVRKLFKMLSDVDCVNVVCYLYSLTHLQFADVEAVSNATGINPEKTQKILDYLCEEVGVNSGNKPFESISLVKKGSKDQKAYAAHEAFAGLFIALFAIADAYVHSAQGFNLSINNRQPAFLKEASGKLRGM